MNLSVKLDAIQSSATVSLTLLVLFALSGCRVPSEQELEEDREFFPRPSRIMSDDDKWCVRQARQRIAALGKHPYGMRPWSGQNRRNLDPLSGIERSDIWAGPHQFSFPFEGVFNDGLWHSELPGAGTTLVLDLPEMRPADREGGGANPHQIGDIQTIAEVRIVCRPDLAIPGALETTREREELLGSTAEGKRVIHPELGLEAFEWKSSAKYVPLEGGPRSPTGGSLVFRCMKDGSPTRNLALCDTGFTYRDGVFVSLRFPTAYLDHWKAIYANTLFMLDEAYRGNK